MRRAAVRAFRERTGIEAAGANQAYSAVRLPENVACRWEPVRMGGGKAVVTVTPVPPSSACRDWPSPAAPNFAVQ